MKRLAVLVAASAAILAVTFYTVQWVADVETEAGDALVGRSEPSSDEGPSLTPPRSSSDRRADAPESADGLEGVGDGIDHVVVEGGAESVSSAESTVPPDCYDGAAHLTVLEEVERERSRIHRELGSVTAPLYDAAFDRGDYRVYASTAEAGSVTGKLVSFRFQPNGEVWVVTLPRKGFEYEYSLKDHLDALERRYRTLQSDKDQRRR